MWTNKKRCLRSLFHFDICDQKTHMKTSEELYFEVNLHLCNPDPFAVSIPCFITHKNIIQLDSTYLEVIIVSTIVDSAHILYQDIHICSSLPSYIYH